MSRSRSEGEERPPVQPINEIVPLTPLQRLLASLYKVQSRTQSLRTSENGVVGTYVRDATFTEISTVLNGGEHKAIDVTPLREKRLSHGDYVRASRMGFPAPDSYTPLPFETDFDAEKARREEATKIARANRRKGSGRNRS